MQHSFYHSIPYLLFRTGPTHKRTKITLKYTRIRHNITSISPIIQRCSTHTKSHCLFSPLSSNRSRRYMSLIFFNPVLTVESPQADYHITRSKISYSLIEPQPLPSTSAYSHEFQALAFHPYSTFAAALVGSTFKIRSEVCGGVSLPKQSTCLGC